MRMAISAASRRRCGAVLVVCVCTLALVHPARGQVTLWKDVGKCPACLCAKAVARMKTGAKTSDFSGCFLGLDQSTDITRIRIIGVRSGKAFATRSDASGGFSFKNVPNAEYVLLATRDEKPLALRTIKVPLNTPILIDVKPVPTNFVKYEY